MRPLTSLVLWVLINAYGARPMFLRWNDWIFRHWRCQGLGKDHRSSGESKWNSTLQVVLAAPSHAGSTSLAVALDTFGLRTHKMREMKFYYSQAFLDGNLTSADMTAALQECGVQAIHPDPLNHLIFKLIHAGPNVKLILRVRDWEEWAHAHQASEANSRLANLRVGVAGGLICHWLPDGQMWLHNDIGSSFREPRMTSLLIFYCFSGLRARSLGRPAKRHYERMLHQKDVYQRTWGLIAKLVPADRILEFDFNRHSWSELSEFLGLPMPDSRTPFPRLRSRKQHIDVFLHLELFPARCLIFFFLLLCRISVNWALFRAACACATCVKS